MEVELEAQGSARRRWLLSVIRPREPDTNGLTAAVHRDPEDSLWA
jgi:hypothetical protein